MATTTTTRPGARATAGDRDAARPGSDRAIKWRRRGAALIVLFLLFVIFSALADRSSSGSFDLASETGGQLTQVTVINDAGPVRVSRFARRSDVDPLFDELGIVSDGPQLLHVDSYLVRAPVIESEVSGSELVVRVSCPTRFPCRSRVEVVVPDGLAALIVAPEGKVQIDGFIGDLTVFAGDDGVALGPVDGSARIVSAGDVEGHALDADNVDVSSINGLVDLAFATLPTSLAVRGSEEPVSVELPPRRIRIDVESTNDEPEIDARVTDRGDRVVVVRSDGPISVVNPPSS